MVIIWNYYDVVGGICTSRRHCTGGDVGGSYSLGRMSEAISDTWTKFPEVLSYFSENAGNVPNIAISLLLSFIAKYFGPIAADLFVITMHVWRFFYTQGYLFSNYTLITSLFRKIRLTVMDG